MEDIQQILRDIVQIEKMDSNHYVVHLPITYKGGDWIALEITQNKMHTFNISDQGLSFDNATAIVNKADKCNIKKLYARIATEYGIKASPEGILYVNQVAISQLYAAMLDVANASQKLSSILIERLLLQDVKKINELVENKLRFIFKEHYKEKVITDYEILGKSTKQHVIPFCINDKKKVLIEPTINKPQSIAMTHTKFFDIGPSDKHLREVVVDNLNDWDSPSLELLKPIAESIISYENLAA